MSALLAFTLIGCGSDKDAGKPSSKDIPNDNALLKTAQNRYNSVVVNNTKSSLDEKIGA